ncbi:hypothetical protein NA56DRAFT_696377 [Hyaloscypha hepaticicola]|uniref:Uncharacterized protein n=1 Tax=Hyaloscypha hepaticicola TaxID=2082293 RepID=A0A2J6QQR0_9HELO|nr:hypothetical protein NA56DRAFT_696377 [Hyaloscypha hepaticicola]
MSEWEKEEAFESLRYLALMQKSKKAYERGDTIRQYESRNGEIISLVDEDDEKPKREEKPISSAKLSPQPEKKPVKVEDGDAVQKEINVKNEPIDIEAPAPTPNPAPVPILARIAEYREPTPTAIENIGDSGLERKRARAKALAEDIEMEERIARLKRERRALEEEIEVAESKKKQRRGGE